MISGRLLMLIGAALGLLAVEGLVNAALLGFVSDSSRSVRLGIAFLCAVVSLQSSSLWQEPSSNTLGDPC